MENKSLTCHMTNKKRLIDASEVKKKIWYGNSDPSNLRQYASGFIDNAPTVEAEIVKHGRWIIKYIKNSKYHYAYCSECETMGSPQWKRCPVCEAKMDGGNEDG